MMGFAGSTHPTSYRQSPDIDLRQDVTSGRERRARTGVNQHRSELGPATALDDSLNERTGPKRILQLDSRSFEVRRVPRHDRKVVHQSGGRDLLVQLVARIGDSQATPHLRRICVESQYVLAELLQHNRQPRLEPLRLLDIPAMANELYAAAEFTHRNRRQVDGLVRGNDVFEEIDDPSGLAFALFRASLITLVSIKYISRSPARSRALEVRVGTDLRHGSKDFGKASPAGTGQRGSQYFPMFGFCAAAVCAGPLLERPHQLFINSTYQQVGHRVLQKSNDINDIKFSTACQGRTFWNGAIFEQLNVGTFDPEAGCLSCA
jgi:hypothetical protein